MHDLEVRGKGGDEDDAVRPLCDPGLMSRVLVPEFRIRGSELRCPVSSLAGQSLSQARQATGLPRE
jgi:hypothetical protein